MTFRTLMVGAAAIALATSAAATPAAAAGQTAEQRIAALEGELAGLRKLATSAQDRAKVENLFSQYMYLHNAFRDTDIIPLWAKKGTPDVRAQYSIPGVYTDWDKIMSDYQGRPAPRGKLLSHFVTTPMIEIAADGQTAKGLWIVNGIDVVRAPYGIAWIPLAAAAQNGAFNLDLMYIGDDGRPAFIPPVVGPATVLNYAYRADSSQTFEARAPEPYHKFSETFAC